METKIKVLNQLLGKRKTCSDATKKFLKHLHETMDYWNDVASKTKLTPDEATQGIIFSILCYIDGMTADCDGIEMKFIGESDGVINPADRTQLLHDLWIDEIKSKKGEGE